MQRETGLGDLYGSVTKPTPGRANQPAVQWHIARKAECLCLVSIFEEYELWSKKAREFTVWAAAVRYWADPVVVPTRGRGFTGLIDWEPLADFSEELRQIRLLAPAPERRDGRA